MVSIIVCSRNTNLPSDFTLSLEQTIGVEYEYVVLDNSKNLYSIFQAYDLGVRKAKGDVLLFVHDDVVFMSENWGKTLCDILSDSKIGLVGVVGTHFLPNTPSSWWDPELYMGQIIQGCYHDGVYSASLDKYKLQRESSSSVVAVDGVFLALRKSSFDLISWDTKTFNGFHCYDLDISMQVLAHDMDVVVSDEIIIEHKSAGNLSDALYYSQEVFVEKWDLCLPIFRGIDMSEGEIEARTRMVQLRRQFKKVPKQSWFQRSRIYSLLHKVYRIVSKG